MRKPGGNRSSAVSNDESVPADTGRHGSKNKIDNKPVINARFIYRNPDYKPFPLGNYFSNNASDNSGQKAMSITEASSMSRNGKVARYTLTMD